MIKNSEHKRQLNEALTDLSKELDVPPWKYEDAKKRYEAVGNVLNEDPELKQYRPEIYPQGSFALGTAIKPTGDEEYDVDAVCLLQLSEDEITQEELKEKVGKCLKNSRYSSMLDPKEGGRRCWTIKYSDDSKFHLDILPAIPDEKRFRLVASGTKPEQAEHAICITDKEAWNDVEWPKSNPKGYLDWFKDSMRVIQHEYREKIALEKQAQVEEVPEYEVRTPLQRAIQLFKRHRDEKYNGDEDKPISIIITTLAAQAYNNENNLVDAIHNMVPKMREGITFDHKGDYLVQNPVNTEENFADKWAETPRKKDIFYEWLNDLERTHTKLLEEKDMQKNAEYLAESYGQRDVNAAMEKYANRLNSSTKNASLMEKKSSLFSAAHRRPPLWPVKTMFQVTIKARYKYNGDWTCFENDSTPLPQGCDLMFIASTEASPDTVYWQVVNTGNAALNANQLRGQIFPAATFGAGGLRQKESTKYPGKHWIECFIVKDGSCIARSGEFVVNIKDC